MSATKKLLAGGFALALLATACGEDLPSTANSGNENITVDGNQIELTSGLASFDSCDALLTHLRTEGAERVGPWGFNHGNYWGPEIMAVDGMIVAEMAMDDMAVDDASDAMEESAPATTGAPVGAGDGAAPREGEDFSGTNNQEAGVDEPDFVKTDGTRILTITNGRFTYVDVADGTPVKRGSVMVGYETSDMLVSGDTVYLFSTTWGEGDGGLPVPAPMPVEPGDGVASSTDAEASFAEDTEAIAEDIEIGRIPGPGGFHGPRARVVQLDISNADTPTVAGQLLIDGFYLSSRLVDGTITIATQSDQHDLGFVFPQGEKGEERAEEFNKQVVLETEINDWLPSYTLDANGRTSEGTLTNCDNVHAPAEFAGFGSLSVLSIDATSGLSDPKAASVLASGQNIYASTESMWISTNRWIDWGTLDEDERVAAENSYSTDIHGFSITGDQPTYTASGSVRGHLLNQFAMSEYDGVLRVASTDGSVWGANENSESFVTTLAPSDGQLEQLGQVGNMGKGERIFSVRFVGETAYIVTFRQTDPFYTVDLSDPAAPEVLGELKITGYSGQLHPLGPDHVLGIGQEATEEGRTTGAKITLFDVSDLSNPVDVDTWTAPNSWTDAEWDHKAFLWWAPENLAVLPVQNWQEQFWGSVAFRIDLDAGTIEEAGRLSHEPDGGSAIGTTDCSVIEPADLEKFQGQPGELAGFAEEAVWIGQDGGQIQVCDPGDSGATGLFCERWDWMDTSELGIEGDLEVCWPQGPQGDPIVRNIVIGDTLWSLSWSRLQANDLGTFEAGPFVELQR